VKVEVVTKKIEDAKVEIQAKEKKIVEQKAEADTLEKEVVAAKAKVAEVTKKPVVETPEEKVAKKGSDDVVAKQVATLKVAKEEKEAAEFAAPKEIEKKIEV